MQKYIDKSLIIFALLFGLSGCSKSDYFMGTLEVSIDRTTFAGEVAHDYIIEIKIYPLENTESCIYKTEYSTRVEEGGACHYKKNIKLNAGNYNVYITTGSNYGIEMQYYNSKYALQIQPNRTTKLNNGAVMYK